MARLLIVEDRFLIAEAMRGALADGGFDVVGVTGLPSDALALAERERPDLALVDVLLSDSATTRPEGVELATCLRRDYGVPSLFVTGARQLLSGDEGLGCVSKPCNYTQLIEAVEASLILIADGVLPESLPEGVQLWPQPSQAVRRAATRLAQP